MKRMTPLACVLILLSLAAVTITPAHGQDLMATYWQGPPGQPGWWHNMANWTGGVPNDWVPAYINNGGIALIDGWYLDSTGSMYPFPPASARSLGLGGQRTGAVEQLGGSLKVVTDLSLGGYGWMPGTYTLSDGILSAGSVRIDPGPPSYLMMGPMAYPGSAFKQGGGTASISGVLHVGTGWIIAADGKPSVTDAPDQYYPYRPGARYDLLGGSLSAGWIYVGYGGRGTLNQSGGANQVAGGLYVGGDPWLVYKDGVYAAPEVPDMPDYYDPGSVYALSGGWLSARSVHVGQWGRGRFVQTGGAGRVDGTLQIGGDWWWWQTAGTAPPEPGMASDVPVNIVLPGDGVYELRAGEIAAARTEIGVGGMGQFAQSGGAHRVAGTVSIGGQPYWVPPYEPGPVPDMPYPYPGPSSGTYLLGGGELRAGRLEIGAGYPPIDWLADAAFAPWVPASLRQAGGAAAIDGRVQIHGGLYHLAGGVLDAGSVHLMGRYYNDVSQFTQSAGICRLAGGLYVGPEFHILGGPDDPNGFAPVYGHQVCTLSGGLLQADHVQVVGGARSLLMQTGGELKVGHTIRVISFGAGYTISGGSVDVPVLHVGGLIWTLDGSQAGSQAGPQLSILSPSARINVRDCLVLDASSQLVAADGSTILMSGADFQNRSVDPVALAGLDRVRMVFSIGPEDDNKWERFEVAGKDLGFVRAGFVDNFVLHTLQLGGEDVGEVALVDTFDNQPGWAGAEALYVRNLIIGPGSRLNTNNFNIYYLNGGDPKQFFLGDANLDGGVGIADLSALASNYGREGAQWRDGDFNGDLLVGIADLSALADNYGLAGKAPAGGATLPEPGAIAVLALGGTLLLLPWRKRRR